MKYTQLKFLAALLTCAFLPGTIQTANAAISLQPAQPGATVTFDASETYALPGGPPIGGITDILPGSVSLLPKGGSAGFVDILGASFPNWTFGGAAAELFGQFVVTVYDAVGTADTVGVDFEMDYTPAFGDESDINNGNFRWIQWVVDNHDVTGVHGANESLIDTASFDPLVEPVVPYYDTLSQAEIAAGRKPFADPPHFEDSPRRSDPDNAHLWVAELYLVEEIGFQSAIIYEGVKWGWQNTLIQGPPAPIPLPASWLLFSSGIIIIGWFSKRAS